jgi:hypothetical protein
VRWATSPPTAPTEGQTTKEQLQPMGITRNSKRKKSKKQKATLKSSKAFIIPNIPIKFNNTNNSSHEAPPVNNSKYPNIYNIARADLSTKEMEILNKGLKFCPTPKQPSALTYESAICNLHRKLLIQGHYALDGPEDTKLNEQLEANKVFQNKYKAPSSWILQSNQELPSILQFAELLKSELIDLPSNSRARQHNIPKRHRSALNRLRQRKDIIIKPADKGGGICILTHKQYTDEAYKQLNNHLHYKELHSDPIPQMQNKIKNIITKHTNTGAIPPKSATLLTQPKPQPARFY